MKNYYEILEVSNNASLDIIKKVFKIQVKKYHPDVISDKDKTFAENKIKELNEAYDILSDKDKRTKYDEELKNNLEDTQEEKVLKEQIDYLKQQLQKKDQIIEHFLGGLDLSEYGNDSIEDIEKNVSNIDDIEYNNKHENNDIFSHNIKENNIPYNENPKTLFEKLQNFFSSSRPFKNVLDYYIHILLIFLLKIGLLTLFVLTCLTLISFITKVNVFEIFFNVFFKN